MKPNKILEHLRQIAPSVFIEVKWSHDDFAKWEGDWTSGKRRESWQAWDSEVRVATIHEGNLIERSDHLGETWELASKHPKDSNPDISGYLPQMIEQALEDLLATVNLPQIGEAIAFIKQEMKDRYDAQMKGSK